MTHFELQRFRDSVAENAYNNRYRKRKLLDERAVDLTNIAKESPRILECYEYQGWTKMLTTLEEASVELVKEFYSNIKTRGQSSIQTWLRGKEIDVTAKLISTLTDTPIVEKSRYPWTLKNQPKLQRLINKFYEGKPYNLSSRTNKRFKLSEFPLTPKMTYQILKNRIYPIKSNNLITCKRSLCLYAVWTQTRIDFGKLAIERMFDISQNSKNIRLPFGALITQIAKHFDISKENTTIVQSKPSINWKFLSTGEYDDNSTSVIPAQSLDGPTDHAGGSTSSQAAPVASPSEARILAAIDVLRGDMQTLQQNMETRFTACEKAIRSSLRSSGRVRDGPQGHSPEAQ